MLFSSFIVWYLGFALAFIFLLLFGESPVFRRTPIASAHWLLTSGIWQAADWVIAKLCGERGQRWLETALECCCDRPNPLLQITYAGFLVIGYWLYWTSIFQLLPNTWASDTHVITGTLAVALAVATWVAACRSDPGTVTGANLSAHRALYVCDGKLWPEKQCGTCGFMRPARSKHCRVCNRCVARHDHHCGWINNCVGLNNLHHFYVFLLANVAMTTYGFVLGAVTLLGDMDRRGVLRHKVLDYRTGGVRILYLHPSRVFEWQVVYHPVGVAVTLFMGLATLILLLFLVYHAYLLAVGKTQYETFRYRDLYNHLLATAEQQQQQQRKEQQREQAVSPGSASQQQVLQQDSKHTDEQQAATSADDGLKAGPTQQGQGPNKFGGPEGKKDSRQQAENVQGAQMQHAGVSQPGEAGSSYTGHGATGLRHSGQAGWCGLLGMVGPSVRVELPPHLYNKGLVKNVSEVLWPGWHLEQASKRAAKQSKQ